MVFSSDSDIQIGLRNRFSFHKPVVHAEKSSSSSDNKLCNPYRFNKDSVIKIKSVMEIEF